MSDFSGNGLPSSFNNDVLTAEPTSSDEKSKLIDEIKNRAKGCISSRNFPEAVKLYTKAIENAEHDTAANAILHANRSMCNLSMSITDAALSDARKALELDSSYVKGYYREAMALRAQGQFNAAKTSLESGLKLKADDKEMKAQLLKIDQDIAKEKQKRAEKPASSATPASIPKISKTSASSDASSARAPASNEKEETTTEAAATDDDDDEHELKNLNLRGYKKTADGRTTTFFNNELDEQAKRLIGDIAPKKLESAAIVAAPVSSSSGSVWNSAGTYEERILTPWASSELNALLSSIHVTLQASDLDNAAAYTTNPSVSASSVSVTIASSKVEDVNGDAQVSMIRGKKKFICDFTLKMHWSVTLAADGEQPRTVEGTLIVFDITADKEFEIGDVEVAKFNGNSCSLSGLPAEVKRLVNSYVKASPRNGMQAAVREKLDAFCDEFKTK